MRPFRFFKNIRKPSHTIFTHCFIFFVNDGEKEKTFIYRDLDTGKIITEWEKRGWQVHRFEPPIWHCVGSYTNRVSIGFINR